MVKLLNENFGFEEDNEYFTRDDINDFAYEVCERMNEQNEYQVDFTEVYLTNGLLELTVTAEGGDFEAHAEHKLDRRKAKYNLDAYVGVFVNELTEQLDEQIQEWGAI